MATATPNKRLLNKRLRVNLEASNFLLVGALYLDEVHEVQDYPQEDSLARGLQFRRSRGGNAATNAVVVASLVAKQNVSGATVHWMGVVPGANDSGAAFCLEQMTAAGVDVSLREEIHDGAGMPSAMVILSRASKDIPNQTLWG